VKIHFGGRLPVVAAVLAAAAAAAMGFLIALGVGSVAAGPDVAPPAAAPNPGHSWSEIGDLPAGFADDVDNDILGGLSCANGQIAKWNGSAWQCATDDTGTGSFWSLTGNSGTTSSNFLGTTDNQPLELRVNGSRALRLEPNATSPDVIEGYSENSVTAGAVGAAIGGGGSSAGAYANTNRVTDDYGTVGGGRQNQAGDDAGNTWDEAYATVGGGVGNTASGGCSTVGGGIGNTASGHLATVGGGSNNAASGYLNATVGGGESNTASGDKATVGGGIVNTASGGEATVGGGESNSAGGQYATVGGGTGNAASGLYATVSGGQWNTASGGATVGGGYSNTATVGATVGGGDGNSASALFATVGGGNNNTATAAQASVGGGGGNRVTDDYGTVAGGQNNQAGDNAGTTTDRLWATVAGGIGNTASGQLATVGGGNYNTANDQYGTVGGGNHNIASATAATVGGGDSNSGSANAATVPGGANNHASGGYSLAAGNGASAAHLGSFVWSSAENTSSWGDNTFTVRSHGGARFYTASGTGTGVQLAAGGGSWSSLSDRDQKENFTPVDSQEVLALLAGMPISTWNLKSQDPSIRHMGPVAQDFYAAFGVGEDERYIGTLDADGVALAAIQGLYETVQDLQAENTELKTQVGDLQARMSALEGGATAEDGPAGPLASMMPSGWLLLGGLLVLSVVTAAIQRRRAGGPR